MYKLGKQAKDKGGRDVCMHIKEKLMFLIA